MFDQRAQTLLKTLIERYIAEGQPVGSRALSRYSGLELSPATIRNVMADLEEMGFISSPHTSAGRIPTPRGYRFFVDGLLTVQQHTAEAGEANSRELNQLEGQIEGRIRPDQPQRVISTAANVLSNLSQFAGVVMTQRRSSAFRHIEFLKLSEARVLLIIVTPDGDVQNRILFVDRAYSASELIEAANFFNQNFAGLDFAEIRSRLRSELQQLRGEMSGLMKAALDAGSEAMSDSAEQVVISGEHNLLSHSDLSANMDKLRELFAVFDQKTGLLQLLDISSRAHGVQIFIGGESQLVPMQDMAVITAPYTANGALVGTLGVIGPTRMAYDRVIHIVDITAKLLSNALSQN